MTTAQNRERGPWFCRGCTCRWESFDPRTEPCGMSHTQHLTLLAGCPLHWPISAGCSCVPGSDGDPDCTVERHAEIARLRLVGASL